MKERIKAFIRSEKSEITNTLSRLVEIPSVKGEATPTAPFGKPCLDALLEVEKLYRDLGLETRIEEGKSYVIGESKVGNKTIGIFTHADVVPVVVEDWTYTSPFTPLLKDGFLIGRGVEDNKSGIVASLFALRAIREAGYKMKSNILLYAGSDEECGMSDLETFVKKEKLPDFSIIPDNAFPVCRGEKGIMNFYLNFKEPFTDIIDISGGFAFNIVLGSVVLTLKEKEGLFDELKSAVKDKKNITVSSADGKIILVAKGKSTHAAHPEGSRNALSEAIEVLNKTSLSEGDLDVLNKANILLSDPYFEKAGLATWDADFGKTTNVNGKAYLKEGRLSLSFDCRYGSGVDADKLVESYKKYFETIDADYVEDNRLEGYVIPEDAPSVKAIMEAWREITGDGDGKPYVSFGGTYARLLPNAVSVGTVVNKTKKLQMPEGHGSVHQPDEALDIEGFLRAIEILAHMIIKIDGVLHRENE